MSTSLSPLLSTAPPHLYSYNPGIAETQSWIPVINTERQLFAKAVYVVNDQNGMTYVGPADTARYYGNYVSITCVTTTTFAELTALNSDGTFTGVAIPAGTVLKAPIKGFKLTSGSIIAQKG